MTPAGRSSAVVAAQLCAMMFLQFFIWGAWYVTAPNYLGTIGFGAKDFGWTYSVGPIAGMISPFFVGMIADRFLATEKVLAVMHLLGGGAMLLATALMGAATPSPALINLVFFGHMLCFFPTLALTNTLAMKNIADSQRQFPLIRVFGTVGWIVAGLVLTQFHWDRTIEMFYLTGGAAIVLGLYSFALPHTPPVASGQPISAREILGLDALVLFRQPAFAIFMVASFLVCIPLAFYYQIASRVVELAGLPIGRTMSYGQMSEIFFMLVMPLFFRKLGVKWMLAVGMLAWVVRYALFSLGAPGEVRWMIIGGILFHGICYDFFFVTGQIYTDQAAPRQIRAQAQGMLVLFTLGLGMFIGAQVAGEIESRFTPAASIEAAARSTAAGAEVTSLTAAGAPAAEVAAAQAAQVRHRHDSLAAVDWRFLWGIPAVLAAVILLAFIFLFRNPRPSDAGSRAT
ncbi:MAG: MFS transporter [Planctomycetota bacterium]